MNSVGLIAIEGDLLRIVLAGALGLLLGLEREWSHKSAGIRTFSLIGLLGAVFTVLDRPLLLAIGGLFVAVQGLILAVQGLLREESGLSLTTSVSMLVAYGVGVLVGTGLLLEGVTVAVLSSLLLVLKRELHSFAWGLTREELRSTTEFAVLAFVIYPLLPTGDVPIAAAGFEVAVEPRVVWLMVVTVAGIGIVNYAIVSSYGGRGIAVTGFFGGLASSTAVVGTMLDHVRQHPAAASYAVAAILLADAAMALRNLGIALAFTIDAPLVGALVPLGTVVVGSFLIAAVTADWNEAVEMELESPFSLRNALGFGAIFLLIVVSGGFAEAYLGTAGFYATAVLSGLVSSAGTTTSAVVLYRTGSLEHDVAVIAILLATASSLVVKALLVATSSDRAFARRVGLWTAVLLAMAGIATAAVLF
ncbi:MgtC/SapB family protein [Halalkalicoccus jeotgali]|uniref:Magnesium transporter accessory protein n=1 Tax=Halalkalicoccus jeotgali (strain DSM 18796 / CECT 7217 / JCM 14584 / KCTC 4019 / B3) TaxID=795797 RepID=D8J382_HALJB|nr:MgtC/SapB family protein [Halalkalicoccus jeotgali]ADJ15189.1 magnesium transporter accessory protein [Halalkalicoccus jeotgali B3]ELY35234.1 magnesium transporter accessory protein [Halalkalicoccus jeotgali B3]